MQNILNKFEELTINNRYHKKINFSLIDLQKIYNTFGYDTHTKICKSYFKKVLQRWENNFKLEINKRNYYNKFGQNIVFYCSLLNSNNHIQSQMNQQQNLMGQQQQQLAIRSHEAAGADSSGSVSAARPETWQPAGARATDGEQSGVEKFDRLWTASGNESEAC